MTSRRVSRLTTMLGIALVGFAGGCNRGPILAPVKGVVRLDGQPLRFGIVMLHPAQGQVAQAPIGSNGDFEASTLRLGDGVSLGRCDVSVLCYEGHDPQRKATQGNELDGFLLGRSLIPLRYTRARSSGLVVDVVPEGIENLELELYSSNR